ncbi:MAG: DegV family protein [Oscillospiraceae bacterium]|nr:DegV family protein [Oscillospiraceae bacterium]
MSKYAVLTDSACDIPPEVAEKHHIDILSFSITLDGKSYVERQDFTFDEYYDMLRNAEGVPTTAQVTSLRFFEQYCLYDDAGCEEVLHVTICGKGSATYESAQLAARQFAEERPASKMKVHIVDSHTYSMVYGYFVVEAAKKLRSNAEMQDVVAYLEDAFSRMEIVLAAYSLKFMKKSGRISAAAAFAGELLGLKPIISLNDGVSRVENKVRGDAAVMPAMLKLAKARIDADSEIPYLIGTTDDERGAQLAKLCKKEFGQAPFAVFKLGAAVTSNTGPDAVAIVFPGQKRRR